MEKKNVNAFGLDEFGKPDGDPMWGAFIGTGLGTVTAIFVWAPGATAVLRWRIKLSTIAREAVNFEQTHLRVLSKDPSGSEKVLLDQAQAGIVDPPGED